MTHTFSPRHWPEIEVSYIVEPLDHDEGGGFAVRIEEIEHESAEGQKLFQRQPEWDYHANIYEMPLWHDLEVEAHERHTESLQPQYSHPDE